MVCHAQPPQLGHYRRDLALEPHSLCLQRERARIPAGERVLDGVEARRILTRRRGVEKATDLVMDHQRRERSREVAQVLGLEGPTTWAARTIFRCPWAYLLDSLGSRSKMDSACAAVISQPS